MRVDEIRALPATLDVATAADVLGVGRTMAYALIRDGEWPTPVIRVGRLIKIPTAPLVSLLGHGGQLDEVAGHDLVAGG